MPSSSWDLIPIISKCIHRHQPKSILDIGIGFGKYGFLAREYTDISNERYDRDQWTTRIDGIEIFPRYIGDIQKYIYNNIYIGDSISILKTLDNYEFIFFIDVIEHMPKESGLEMLNLIKKKCKVGLIATPLKMAPQESFCGNENERHICAWTEKELSKFGAVKIIKNNRGILLLVINN